MTKKYRHKIIKDIIRTKDINSQEMLLNILIEKGFGLTQATLSRDIKELKIIKVPTAKGSYVYQFSNTIATKQDDPTSLASFGYISLEFSGSLAVMKTRPGYAMAIAGEIDNNASRYILGTVAGDDTILLIPRENFTREDIIKSLSDFIPTIEQ